MHSSFETQQAWVDFWSRSVLLPFREGKCGWRYLNLLHRQVQESVLIAHADQALGALAAHAGAQASVQLHHHQLVEALGHIVGKATGGDFIIRLNLEKREKEKRPAG